MFAPRHDFFRALDQARRATRGGNHAAASHWTRIAERHLKIAERLDRLAAPALRPATAAAIRTEPVMLDPDSFSPGGAPNWVLNQKRRELAGMPPA